MSATSIRQWLPFDRLTVYRLHDLLICIAASTQYEVLSFDFNYTLIKTSVKNEDVFFLMKTFFNGNICSNKLETVRGTIFFYRFVHPSPDA